MVSGDQPEVTYDFIRKHSSVFPVEKMCSALDISRSGYYDWCVRPESKRDLENKGIFEIAKRSYQGCRGICGLNKMLEDVREKFPKCSRKRLYRIQTEIKYDYVTNKGLRGKTKFSLLFIY